MSIPRIAQLAQPHVSAYIASGRTLTIRTVAPTQSGNVVFYTAGGSHTGPGAGWTSLGNGFYYKIADGTIVEITTTFYDKGYYSLFEVFGLEVPLVVEDTKYVTTGNAVTVTTQSDNAFILYRVTSTTNQAITHPELTDFLTIVGSDTGAVRIFTNQPAGSYTITNATAGIGKSISAFKIRTSDAKPGGVRIASGGSATAAVLKVNNNDTWMKYPLRYKHEGSWLLAPTSSPYPASDTPTMIGTAFTKPSESTIQTPAETKAGDFIVIAASQLSFENYPISGFVEIGLQSVGGTVYKFFAKYASADGSETISLPQSSIYRYSLAVFRGVGGYTFASPNIGNSINSTAITFPNITPLAISQSVPLYVGFGLISSSTSDPIVVRQDRWRYYFANPNSTNPVMPIIQMIQGETGLTSSTVSPTSSITTVPMYLSGFRGGNIGFRPRSNYLTSASATSVDVTVRKGSYLIIWSTRLASQDAWNITDSAGHTYQPAFTDQAGHYQKIFYRRMDETQTLTITTTAGSPGNYWGAFELTGLAESELAIVSSQCISGSSNSSVSITHTHQAGVKYLALNIAFNANSANPSVSWTPIPTLVAATSGSQRMVAQMSMIDWKNTTTSTTYSASLANGVASSFSSTLFLVKSQNGYEA